MSANGNEQEVGRLTELLVARLELCVRQPDSGELVPLLTEEHEMNPGQEFTFRYPAEGIPIMASKS